MIRKLVPLALVLALPRQRSGSRAPSLRRPAPPPGSPASRSAGRPRSRGSPSRAPTTTSCCAARRRTNITTTVTPAGGTTGTSFTNTGLSNSTTYYYVVRAVGASVTEPQLDHRAGHPALVDLLRRQRDRHRELLPGHDELEDDQRPTTPSTASRASPPPAASTPASRSASRSTPPPVPRTGWRSTARGSYNGDQGRLISTIPSLTAVSQPTCDSQSNTGLLDCSNWSTSATLTTTSSWKTGVYLIRLVRSNNTDFHVLLTVRNDSAQRRRPLRRPATPPTRPTTTTAASRSTPGAPAGPTRLRAPPAP